VVKGELQGVRMEYEEKRSSQAATKSHGKVLDALLQQKKNGNIPGIIARLGDLGAIDKVGEGNDTIRISFHQISRSGFIFNSLKIRWI